MENNTYNWRSNRATWLVWLWYSPETLDDVDFAQEDIGNKYEEMDWFMKDLVRIDEIDWAEIRESVEKENESQNN